MPVAHAHAERTSVLRIVLPIEFLSVYPSVTRRYRCVKTNGTDFTVSQLGTVSTYVWLSCLHNLFLQSIGIAYQMALSRLIIQMHLKEDLINTGSIRILYDFRAQTEGTGSRSNVSRVNVV